MRSRMQSWWKVLNLLGIRLPKHGAARRRGRARNTSFEPLEGRQLLTVTIDFGNFAPNRLTVTGDSQNEVIAITAENVAGTDYVRVNGQDIGNVSTASVQSIHVDSGDGDDQIVLSSVVPASFTTLNDVMLEGGLGSDTIIAPSVNSTLSGGAGDDIYVFSGSDDLGTDTISDSSGVDTLDFSGLILGADVDGVTADLVSGTATVTNGVTLTVNFSALENVIGTAGDDVLTAIAGTTSLQGGVGDDDDLP